jgi:hypothetical protein
MHTVVHFDRNFHVIDSELEGGHYISLEEYEAPDVSQVTVSDQPED